MVRILILLFITSNALGINIEANIKNLLTEKFNYKDNVVLEITYTDQYKFNYLKNHEDIIENIVIKNFSDTHFISQVTLSPNLNLPHKIEISGKIDRYMLTPVAQKSFKSGELINSENISYIKTKANKRKIEEDSFEVIGMETKNFIRKGSKINPNNIRKPFLVKENDVVTLLYAGNKLKIKTLGLAVTSGAVGDTIKVKNQRSGGVVFGTVKDRNVVQINAKLG